MKKGTSLQKARQEGYNEGCREILDEMQGYLQVLFQRQARKECGNIPVPTLRDLEQEADKDDKENG